MALLISATILQSCGTGDWEEPEERARKEEIKFDAKQEQIRREKVLAEQEQKLSLVMSRLQATGSEAERVIQLLDDLESEIAIWAKTIDPLLVEKDGQALAANTGYVKAFQATYKDYEDINNREIQSIRSQINEILSPIRESIKKKEPYLSDENEWKFIEIIERAKDYAKTSLEQLTMNRRIIEDMVNDSKKDYSGGGITLKEAIDADKQRFSLIRAVQLAKDMEEDRENEAKEIEAALRKKASAITNAKKKKIEVETEKIKVQTRLDEARARAERDKINSEIEADAARLEIQQDLAKQQAAANKIRLLASDKNTQDKFRPFLAKGYKIINYIPKDGTARFRKGNNIRTVPLSFSELTKHGATDKLENFVKIGTSKNNDRPPWPYPRTEGDWKMYEEMFEKFKKLAPIWVEMGLLGK